jgi:hypothetical protein
VSAFRTRGVPGPTSKFVAACPCPDGLAQDGTQGVTRLVLSCTRGVLVVGVTSVTRERERESMFVSSFPHTTPLPQEGPRPPFYRCKERVQMYNGGCSYALTCLAEECMSPMYMPTWLVGEVLEPCVRDNVAVGEVPEPCRSTAVDAAGILLTSPCFRRGLRTTDVIDARGEPSLPVTGASQMRRRSCSLVA